MPSKRYAIDSRVISEMMRKHERAQEKEEDGYAEYDPSYWDDREAAEEDYEEEGEIEK